MEKKFEIHKALDEARATTEPSWQRIVMVNGLRIYIDRTESETTGGDPTFYSRRSDGPYYRWHYEQKLEQWCVARMHLSDFSPNELSMSNWKTVPYELQKNLIDHYQE